MTTTTYVATLEVLQACEALEAFTREARENLRSGLPTVPDEQQKALLMQALDLINGHLLEACAVMLEPHYPTPIDPEKTA
ncbi:hypothetical protein [Pseudomonas sp. RT6P73]